MSIVIGLTGSIASGKSAVAAMFKELLIPVIDADQIARDVVEPGESALQAIVNEFGHDILLPDGTLDRKKLGAIIFSDTDKRAKLNAIVHPAVRKRMLEQKEHLLENGAKCVVMDIPLLFESKLTHMVDKTLVVYVDEDVQLQRLVKRDNSQKEEALQRIQSQIPLKEKVKLADAVIDNNGTLEHTLEQLQDVLNQWGIPF
ncbi:dephospho-CoA kinase [Ornithinibacillus sp. BX22]|uniref:Dephospho-CoA kinase n=2 Tax=Ornithinibacillus TaxID=484508 RepID=A0A923RIV6_9BACI|nr:MULTISPECIES: dephospho-CoA kinase [Ornithinibacillus]MBC5637490.1 dephospho-CoA kinase [Ornithinibacillus hominis]MBS3682058.1 dephospho-CoA kinase [Ornithinibacillus massiliensis]